MSTYVIGTHRCNNYIESAAYEALCPMIIKQMLHNQTQIHFRKHKRQHMTSWEKEMYILIHCTSASNYQGWAQYSEYCVLQYCNTHF